MKNLIYHGLLSGILSGMAGVIYLNIYQEAMYVDFSSIINIGSILGASILGCILMTIGYSVLLKFKKQNLKGWLNIAIAVLSFASIISPIMMSLPLDIESPELFPGLVVPMHFFPALAFFALAPFFQNSTS